MAGPPAAAGARARGRRRDRALGPGGHSGRWASAWASAGSAATAATATRCRAGDFVLCRNMRVPGISYDGGYAEYMVAPVRRWPGSPTSCRRPMPAPLLCAGVTTFNPLRQSGARAGDLVAIQGIGGLGHLAVQYAAKMGYNTVAIARGKDKEAEARQLGAHHYIDAASQDVAAALQALGGARVILTTVTNSDAMSAAMGGLGLEWQADRRRDLSGADSRSRRCRSSSRGRRSRAGPRAPRSTRRTRWRSARCSGVRPMIETVPLERAAEAYERMMSGKARFRVVITMNRR